MSGRKNRIRGKIRGLGVRKVKVRVRLRVRVKV